MGLILRLCPCFYIVLELLFSLFFSTIIIGFFFFPSVPNNAPVITNVVLNNNTAVIQWSPLPNDQWNGIRLNYVIVIADITSQLHYSYIVNLNNANYSMLPDVLSSIIGELKVC